MARVSLSSIPGIGDVTAEFLFQHGFKSAQEVADAGELALAEVEGIEVDRIPAILEAARAQAEELKRLSAEADAAEAAAAALPLPDLTEAVDAVVPQVPTPTDAAPDVGLAGVDPVHSEREGGAS